MPSHHMRPIDAINTFVSAEDRHIKLIGRQPGRWCVWSAPGQKIMCARKPLCSNYGKIPA